MPTPAIPVESGKKWTRASFGVYAETFDPEEITMRLGLQPSLVRMKGDIISTRYDPQQRRRKTSAWVLTCPLNPDAPMPEHLAWLLDQLEARRGVIRELAQKFKVLVVCGFSSENGQGGFTLEPTMLARLASLGIPLSLDLYPPGPPNPDEASSAI